tara:strand:- start:386 stop:1087 length:702 start_codon:yes stop_codon:yes gene_type:complete
MDKNLKKVSVLMSTYNSEENVANSIESILGQSYKNIEFLIMDDCSTDNTFKILEEYSNNHQSIKVFKNEINIGLTKSLNLLIASSKGDFIARQDDDDTSYPDRIKTQVDILQNPNIDFCSTRALTDPKKRKIPGISFYFPIKFLLKFKNPFIHGSLVFKKEILNSVGGYDEDFYYSQDLKLILNLIQKGYNYKIINKVLYKLNIQNNISEKKFKEQEYYAGCARRGIKPNLVV